MKTFSKVLVIGAAPFDEYEVALKAIVTVIAKKQVKTINENDIAIIGLSELGLETVFVGRNQPMCHWLEMPDDALILIMNVCQGDQPVTEILPLIKYVPKRNTIIHARNLELEEVAREKFEFPFIVPKDANNAEEVIAEYVNAIISD